MATPHGTKLIDASLFVMGCCILLCAVGAVLAWPTEGSLRTRPAGTLPAPRSTLSGSMHRNTPAIRMTGPERRTAFRSESSSPAGILDGDGYLQVSPVRGKNSQYSGDLSLVDQRELVDLVRRQTGSFALGLAALLIALAGGLLLAVRQSMGILAERLSRIEQRCQEAGAQARDTAYFAPGLRPKNDDDSDQ